MKILNFKLQFSLIFVYFCAFFLKVSTIDNAPEEITELFNVRSKNASVFEPAGTSGLRNNHIYAEGSSSTVNTKNHEISKTMKLSTLEQVKKNDLIQTKNENHTAMHTNNEALLKLDKNILNLNLSSIDEIVHGTSSIKPRKGVSYSKSVPKKGVNFEDYLNYSISTNHSCFFLNTTNCYDVDYYYKNIVCNCCNKSNDLGELIGRQPLTNCSTCLPINDVNVEVCTGICCKNITQTTTGKHDISVNKKIYEVSESSKFLNVNLVEENHVKKKKPVVTNVPHDSDAKNLFSKSKGEKYIPIVVSIFILPLVGVLIFFMWKKTYEIWDRRYYKKMDFLIDGMYNE